MGKEEGSLFETLTTLLCVGVADLKEPETADRRPALVAIGRIRAASACAVGCAGLTKHMVLSGF
eukprot:1634081-Rhodomonas_salina.2